MGKRKDLLAGVVVSALGFSVRAADCNQNGLDDYQEIRSRARLDCNLNGIPDECDILPVNFGLVELPVPKVSGTTDIHATDLDGDGAADFVFLDPFGRRVLLL